MMERLDLLVKVYDDHGKLLEIYHAETHEEAIGRLDDFPSIVVCARTGGLKIRIEDESGSGCWVVVGGRSQARLFKPVNRKEKPPWPA
jgi:hypothetical protein